jgi:hypothetical protein
MNIPSTKKNIPKGRIHILMNNMPLTKANQAPRDTVKIRQIKINTNKPQQKNFNNLNLYFFKKQLNIIKGITEYK